MCCHVWSCVPYALYECPEAFLPDLIALNRGLPAARPQFAPRLVCCGLADPVLFTGCASHNLYVAEPALYPHISSNPYRYRNNKDFAYSHYLPCGQHLLYERYHDTVLASDLIARGLADFSSPCARFMMDPVGRLAGVGYCVGSTAGGRTFSRTPSQVFYLYVPRAALPSLHGLWQ